MWELKRYLLKCLPGFSQTDAVLFHGMFLCIPSWISLELSSGVLQTFSQNFTNFFGSPSWVCSRAPEFWTTFLQNVFWSFSWRFHGISSRRNLRGITPTIYSGSSTEVSPRKFLKGCPGISPKASTGILLLWLSVFPSGIPPGICPREHLGISLTDYLWFFYPGFLPKLLFRIPEVAIATIPHDVLAERFRSVVFPEFAL